MTDYTQMTNEELATVIDEAQAAQYEITRRSRLSEAPRQMAHMIFAVGNDQGDKVEAVVRAMNTTWAELDAVEGPEYNIPAITNEEAAEVIAALQDRINAV